MTFPAIRRTQWSWFLWSVVLVSGGSVAMGLFAPSTGQPGGAQATQNQRVVAASFDGNRLGGRGARAAHAGTASGGVHALAMGSSAVCIPTSAHSPGAAGTTWRTDLEVHNPGSVQAGFTVALLKRDTDNTSSQAVSYTLGPGRSQRYVDAVQAMFSFQGAAALQVTATAGTMLVTSRTYNDQPGGTYGQFVPAYVGDDAIGVGEEGRLIELGHEPDLQAGFRTNLGLVNAGSVPITVQIDLYASNGVQYGTVAQDLRGYEYKQLDKVFERVTSGNVVDGYAVVRTATPGGAFYAYASVIDNRTGDPICVPAQILATNAATPTPTPTGPPPTPTTPPPTATPTQPPAANADLRLYTPSSWPACVVCDYRANWDPSITPFLSIYYDTNVFVNIANYGSSTFTGPVELALSIDGVSRGTWTWGNSSGLQALTYITVPLTDTTHNITAGQHTVRVVIDPNSKINLANRSYNNCSANWTWSSILFAPQPAAKTSVRRAAGTVTAAGLFSLDGRPATTSAASYAAAQTLYIPTSAHSGGAAGTTWRTDLEVHNPGSVQAAYTVELLKRDTDNTSSQAVSYTLGPGQSVRYVDALMSMFSFSGAAALRVTMTVGVVLVTSRTYNDQPQGSYGQFVGGFEDRDAIGVGDEGRLIQLGHVPSLATGFRTNVGMVNAGAAPITVQVDLYASNGSKYGTVMQDLRGYEYKQLDKIFEQVTGAQVDDGYAVLTTAAPGGRFFAYASVIDNRTGDPVCIPAQKPAPGFVYGLPHSIPVNAGGGLEVTDPTTGVIFDFPQGGHGTLTTANIITPPYVPGGDGSGFHFQFTGPELVEFRLAQDPNAETEVWTYGSPHGCFDGGPVGPRWYPWPESSVPAGYLLFDVPDESAPFSAAAAGMTTPQAVTPMPFHDYWVRKIQNGSSEAQARYAYVQQIRTDISAWLSKLSGSLLTAAQTEANTSFAVTRVYNDSQGGGYIGIDYHRGIGSVFNPRLALKFWNTPDATVAHETGHLMNHLLLRARLGQSAGNAKYWQIQDLAPDANHALGDNYYPRITTTEEAAFISQYLIENTIDNIVPSDGRIWRTYFRDTPDQVDFPSYEGFGAVLLANLMRTDTSLIDWQKKSADAPAMGRTWNDVASIIGMGAANINEYLANIQAERSPGGGSSDLDLEVNAERLGWSYHGYGTVYEAGTSNPVAGATVKNIIRLSTNEFVASQTTTDAGGHFYPPRLFPGWSQIHVEKDSAVTDSNLTIDWGEPTTVLIPIGTITLAAPTPTPTPTPTGGLTVTVSPASVTLAPGGTQAFTATVTGTPNTAVTWSIQEGAAGGTITSGGVYKAPSTSGTYHVIAQSQADPNKSGVATVIVSSCLPENKYAASGKATNWNGWIAIDYSVQGLAISDYTDYPRALGGYPIGSVVTVNFTVSGLYSIGDTGHTYATISVGNQVVESVTAPVQANPGGGAMPGWSQAMKPVTITITDEIRRNGFVVVANLELNWSIGVDDLFVTVTGKGCQ